jgi:hypothetical protein
LNKKTCLVIGLFLALSAIGCLNINPVLGGTGNVTGISISTSGIDTILYINVYHENVGTSHIDTLEIDIDGNVYSEPVNGPGVNIFQLEYNMGQVTGTPTVSARVHCDQEGWGPWSDPIVVPEFPLIHLLLILISISTAVVLLKSRITAKLKK